MHMLRVKAREAKGSGANCLASFLRLWKVSELADSSGGRPFKATRYRLKVLCGCQQRVLLGGSSSTSVD